MPQLLVVEDQTTLLQSLKRGLTGEGYDVLTAQSGTEAYDVATREQPDAVILDLLLPDGNGLTTLGQLRDNGYTKPVLILTARDSIEDRILGLDTGADDYLVKPFAFGELLARLRALIRRNGRSADTILTVSDLEMNLLTRTVVRAGVEIELTARQFSVLEYLLRNQNQVVSREMLARDVWKAPTASWTNVIEVKINQLRKKIERKGWKPLLHTIRKEGYLIGESP
jgi:DNA-binding response OmpR family regulator